MLNWPPISKPGTVVFCISLHSDAFINDKLHISYMDYYRSFIVASRRRRVRSEYSLGVAERDKAQGRGPTGSTD